VATGSVVAACISIKDEDAATPPSDLKVFTREEIATHNSEENGVWIVVKGEVYDMTEFVEAHPGGKEKILLAAGSNVEPYWNIYRQHYKQAVENILKNYHIGTTNPEEWASSTSNEEHINNPYASDPERNPILHYHSKQPCNAEPPQELIAHDFITPNELFFIRNHSPVPVLDEDNFRLVIQGREGQEDRTFTLKQLKTGFKRVEHTASIQCGGNRRHGLNEVTGKPLCSGTDWNLGAISTATWAGASLRQVLEFCGHNFEYCANQKVQHVIFEGADGVQASIPIQKALCPGECVILAYEMNGKALPRDHGYPVRALVPGHVGIRNIKWVTNVKCSTSEAMGPWQRGIAYKGFSPSRLTPSGVDVEKLISLQEMPVQSAIVQPAHTTHAEVEDDAMFVRGYAWSGGGRGIIRVDVSADGGQTWYNASLGQGHEQPLDQAWAWTLWEIDLPVPANTRNGTKLEVVCRATDASYNVQPGDTKSIWNLRGIANNAAHRIEVRARKDDR